MLNTDNNTIPDSGAWSIDSLQAKRSVDKKVTVKTDVREAQTVIGVNCRLNGNLQLTGTSRIDGNVEGEIFSEGELTVGETAEIKSTINGQKVSIFGRVVGNIICSERLELFAGAKVSGCIVSPRIVMHDGVVFDGTCRMGQQQANWDSHSEDLITLTSPAVDGS